MRVFLRGRASQVLLWSAFVAAAMSSGGRAVVDAQAPPMRWDGLIELISGRYDYPPPTTTPPNPADGPSEMSRHAVSGDGRYIVFTAQAPSLGFYGPAVYIRDRRMGDTRVLVGGTMNPGSALRDAVISADGRHVAFTICEPYMRPDQAPICDVWSHDTLTYSMTPLSVGLSGVFGNGDSDQPVLSSTGRFVVFRTAATNLVNGSAPTAKQLVIRDRDFDGNGIFDEPGTQRMEFVSAPDRQSGANSGSGPSETAEVSADGRYVAFRSLAANLVNGDTNNAWDVFRRDRKARETRRVNVRPYQPGYEQSPASIDSAAISMTPDGRYIAFASVDPMLAPSAIDDYNNVSDVFVFDAAGQAMQRLDIGYGPPIAGGQIPGNGPTEWPTLSDDGRYVSVQSAAINVEVPPYPNTTHSYVIDRMTRTATRVSRKPDGTEPDHDSVRPTISGDGSLVAFVSQAFNLAPNVVTDSDRVYAAVHFEITPEEQTVPGGGGSATYQVTTQQHTLWWIDWTYWQPWLSFETMPMGTGSGAVTVKALEPNPDATPRTAKVRFFEKSVAFTQLAGLSLSSVSPAIGPDTGGTQVTITGTGFEPGMRVIFGSADATAVEFVDSTTMIATSPAQAPGTVYVAVLSAPPDYRSAWIDGAFRYTDTTPPQIWYGFSDTPNEDGWFSRDVTLYWAWYDEQTGVTSTSGCETAVINVDTPGTTYTCTATSEGGTASLSAFVKRDATPPTATITSPQFTLYDLGQVVEPAFTCSDALSGVASCVGGTNGQPIDTSTPGYHSYGVSITDRAGNPGYVSVDYVVGFGVCASALPDMVGWWRMEGNTSNMRSSATTNATRVGLTSDVYVDAVVGQGYQFQGANGYLQTNFAPALLSDKKLAIAAWVNPSADTRGTILRARDFFSIARLETGTIGFAFKKWGMTVLSHRDTRVPLPLGRWSHVVVALDGWAVRAYVNGRLAYTEPAYGDVDNPGSYTATIGGADNNSEYFKGALDEVQIFQHGLTDAQIEQLFLAGNAGACVPKRTSFQIAEPIPASFGSPTYAFDARLVDEDGLPVAGRTVELMSQVGAAPYSTSTANLVTDGDGRVHWDAPLKNAPRDLYENFAYASFSGDIDYVRALASPDVLVGKGNPVITWPAPAPITYGFPVNGTQLNATANVPGAFTYSPRSGTLTPAGVQTLSVTFTPTDSGNYNTVTATNTMTVDKATPNVVIEAAGTWAYTGSPHAVVGKVKDRFNLVIAIPDVTYDGSPDPPVMPGTYTVVATFPGNANYLAGSATETLTITKSAVDIWINVQDVTYNGSPFGAGYLISGVYPEVFHADSVTYNGSENSPVDAGTYTVVVTFNGTAVYEAATAWKTFTIHPATPTVTVSGGTFTYDGRAHAAVAKVTGIGGVDLGGGAMLTYNGSADAPINAGTYTAVATFDGSGNYGHATGSAVVTINKATAVFAWSPPAPIVYGTSLSGDQLNATADVFGSFDYLPAAGTALNAGASQTLTATFTPADPANYYSGTVSTTIDVSKAVAEVTAIGGTFTYNGQPHTASGFVTAVFGAPLGTPTFTYNGGSQPPVNAGIYDVVASFAGNANYEPASAPTAIAILQATPIVDWQMPQAIVYGTPLADAQLNATASVPGTFTYTPGAGTVLNAGPGQLLSARFTPADPNYSADSIVNTVIDVAKAAPVLNWAQPATIVYGTPLGAAHLNATANVPGTFAYSPAAGTVLSVGKHQLTATFTPADAANYSGGTVSTPLAVAPATLTVRANDAAKPFGAPLPGFTASAAGFVNGDTFASLSGSLVFATSATALSAVGTYPVTPAGLSSSNYAIAFAAGTLTVVRGGVTVSVSTSPSPSGLNQTMTFTASVGAAAPAAGVPGGTVRFFDGATLVGSSTLSAGSASLTTAGLTAGVHTIQAQYDGDASFAAGAGSSPHTVNSAAATPTVTIASSRNPSSVGQSVMLTATLGMSAGPVTGTVEFYDGAALLGSSAIVGGSATFTTSALAAGSHAITVRYLGSASAPPAISGVFVQAVGSSGWKNRTSSTTVSASPNPAAIGASVTLTASVSGSNGAPAGAVLFMVNGEVVGGPVALTAISGSTARATFVVSGLAGGRHTVTATYLGNSSYKGSTALVTQTVN